jgi:hypothetical protein
MRAKTLTGIAAAAGMFAAGCVHGNISAGDRCWPDANAIATISQEVVSALTERQQSDAEQLRRLSGTPLDTTSIQRRRRVVADADVCRRIATRIDPEHPTARVAVVMVGRAYWAMSSATEGIDALDDRFRVVMHVVFLH